MANNLLVLFWHENQNTILGVPSVPAAKGFNTQAFLFREDRGCVTPTCTSTVIFSTADAEEYWFYLFILQ